MKQRMKARRAGLKGLKVLIYRPLWMVLLLGGFTLLYVNLVAPRHDVEIENIEKTSPPPAPVGSAPDAYRPGGRARSRQGCRCPAARTPPRNRCCHDRASRRAVGCRYQ